MAIWKDTSPPSSCSSPAPAEPRRATPCSIATISGRAESKCMRKPKCCGTDSARRPFCARATSLPASAGCASTWHSANSASPSNLRSSARSTSITFSRPAPPASPTGFLPKSSRAASSTSKPSPGASNASMKASPSSSWWTTRTPTTRCATSSPWPAGSTPSASSPSSAAVAVATAAEEGDDALGVEPAGHGDDVAQRVVGVRVVHHDDEGLAFIDAFEAPGDGFEVGDAARDDFRREPVGEAGGAGRENVIDVDLADERRFDGEALFAECQVEAQPAEAGSDVARAQNGLRAESVPQHFGLGMHLDAARPLIVAIEHGVARRGSAGAGEEQLLGGEVSFHIAMKIEMVARQVGENRGVEVETVNAAEREGVGGDLHGDVRAAGAFQLAQQTQKVERF